MATITQTTQPQTAANPPTGSLVVKNLQKSFKKRQVVKDFSLDIRTGEVVGLLGPNGAGKTTSFYMIVGLIAADTGSILLDGSELRHMPIHERARLGLGYLPQEASIFRKMTVEQNIRSILEIRLKDKKQIDAELSKLLADLNIERLRESPAPSLSGGERRRVEIARVLAMQPRFILLDEPFAGVDPIAVIDIQKIIEFLKARGIGVLITDHNVRETLRICDRGFIINDGRVLATGTPEELVNNEEVRAVYLGENFDY
jgi:lipopolysaccharide export system ATP-binding protein